MYKKKREGEREREKEGEGEVRNNKDIGNALLDS